MSLYLDLYNKPNNDSHWELYINGFKPKEMWFNGEQILVGDTTPSVNLRVAKRSKGRIRLIGEFNDFDHRYKYFPIVEHGFVYIPKIFLGASNLNVNTEGRTKVKCSNYFVDSDSYANGTYIYSMTPKTESTRYAIRAYLVYKDENNMRHYIYSYHVFTEYESL